MKSGPYSKWEEVIFLLMITLVTIIITVPMFLIGFKIGNKERLIAPVDFQVLDVIDCHKVDNQITTARRVQINEHEFIMTTSSGSENVSFKHHPECRYCMRHNTLKYAGYCFTILDGFNCTLMEKLNKLKQLNDVK